MTLFRLTADIFFWHYRQGILDLLHIWGNLIALVYRVFSVLDLLKTFFLPWKRMSEPYRKGPGFSFEQFFGGVIVNIMMRLVGALTRTFFLILFVIFFVLTLGIGLVVFLVWFFIPLVMLASFFFGIGLLFF